jgi:hypothetical protein
MSVLQNEEGGKDAISFLLGYFERIGAIESALDVWTGKKTLSIDSSKYESAEDLKAKLVEACALSAKTNIEYITKKIENADDFGEEPTTNVFKKLTEIDRNSPLIPMWMSQHHGHIVKSRIYFPGTRPVTALFGECGFTPSPEMRLGITGTRHTFRNDSNALTKEGFNAPRHLELAMDHSAKVANKHYDDKSGYQKSVPHNVLQAGVSREAALEAIENVKLASAYEIPGLFSDKVKFRDGSTLPWKNEPELLLKEFAAPDFRVGGWKCPGKGCNEEFHFDGDWNAHIQTCDKVGDECPHCSLSRSEILLKAQGDDAEAAFKLHVTLKCKEKQFNRRVSAVQKKKDATLDFMSHLQCHTCNATFGNKKNLATHQTRCKGAKIKSGKENPKSGTVKSSKRSSSSQDVPASIPKKTSPS